MTFSKMSGQRQNSVFSMKFAFVSPCHTREWVPSSSVEQNLYKRHLPAGFLHYLILLILNLSPSDYHYHPSLLPRDKVLLEWLQSFPHLLLFPFGLSSCLQYTIFLTRWSTPSHFPDGRINTLYPAADIHHMAGSCAFCEGSLRARFIATWPPPHHPPPLDSPIRDFSSESAVPFEW